MRRRRCLTLGGRCCDALLVLARISLPARDKVPHKTEKNPSALAPLT